MDSSVLPTAAFIVLGLVFCIYALLDGFDLGIGMLFPWLGRSEKEKSAVLSTIAPVWDGNEVWLVMGGAYLFAFFPPAFGAALSTLWLPVLTAVFALMLRAAAFEFWYQGGALRKFWEIALCAGSWMVTLILGLGFGCVISGIDVTDHSFAALVKSIRAPLSLATGAAGLLLFLLHGCAYIAIKVPDDRAARCRGLGRKLAVVGFCIVFVWLTLCAMHLPHALSRPLFWIGSIAALAGMAGIIFRLGFVRVPLPLFSGCAITGAMVAALAAHFPAIIRAPVSGGQSLTVITASSSTALLKTMVPFSVVWIVFIVAFTVFIYRTFKGRVSGEEHGY